MRISGRILSIALAGSLMIPTFANAQAGQYQRTIYKTTHQEEIIQVRGGGHRKHRRHGRKHVHHHHHYKKKGISGGEAVAIGVLGLAAGALIAGAAKPSYVAPPPAYHPPQPSYRPPVHTYRPQPWTSEWYAYCAGKYRSFNPSTGTYTAYSGATRFCQ
ncbi:BA14K family protein [Pseudovibrio exalbescens]|uniref:Lectin-like protein BA14k n=1 Tax=Pseudovibrio exalbescens TaxID=197461 RepID=A0A1U7JL22_9HYPH|nr:BA14K family protein [Pseudovibrio exalbescens]OKL45417.1 hypothetical protein A3843_03600 [Pseudovibrio exalbescens]